MKIYISGAVTGTDDYMERFAAAEEYLEERYPEAVVIINPAKVISGMPLRITWEEYMELSLVMLNMCDAIYMLNGWQQSRGACMEYGYAKAKGYEILNQEEQHGN